VTKPVPFHLQIAEFFDMLERGIENSPINYDSTVSWLKDVVEGEGTVEPEVWNSLLDKICQNFEVSRQELQKKLDGGFKKELKKVSKFDLLIPNDGFLRLYYDYTLQSEPPTVFHFFCGLTAFGASLQRRVRFNRGLYNLYPYFATVLVAPTGICRKTSAANVATSLLREVGNILVLSDRLTPEYICYALGIDRKEEDACALVYAPEFADFIGKQRYLEGLVPLLTSLFDCPDKRGIGTITRKDESLYNVAVCMLACSTEDWLTDAMPSSIFGGGFMSRLLLIVQNSTDRCFPTPPMRDEKLWDEMVRFLNSLHRIEGDMIWESSAKKFFDDWYFKHHRTPVSNERFAGYHQRKPDHLIRVAMCLQLAEWGGLVLQIGYLQDALKILNWTEQFLPEMFERVTASSVGSDHQKLLGILEKAGGSLSHSHLLRKVQYYMNARQFRECIQTLKESKSIEEKNDPLGRRYLLK